MLLFKYRNYIDLDILSINMYSYWMFLFIYVYICIYKSNKIYKTKIKTK
jgi:hypothetical protein